MFCIIINNVSRERFMMKRETFAVLFALAGFFTVPVFAESEPNDTCLSANPIYELENAVSRKVVTVTGSTVSKGYEEGTNKPDYDRDNFYFAPGIDGVVKVKFQSSGFTNFFIGVPVCNRNVTGDFTSYKEAVFYAKKGERVNILAMCRHPRNYKMDIEFIPDSKNSSDSVKISVEDVSETEGDEGVSKEMVFVLKLDRPSSRIVGVDFKTESLTALPGKDYESKVKRVVFMPGEVEKSVKVTVTGDDKKEENEKFKVLLDNPYHAVIERGEAIGTIVDDDTGFLTSSYFDREPNDDCSLSEVIPELDGAKGEVRFKAKGKVDPAMEGNDEARDYFHFAPGEEGNLTIELSSDKAVWFTLGNRGCFSPWADEDKWNLHRGSAFSVSRTLNVKKGERIDIAAVSYDPKNYEMKIVFTPEKDAPSYKESGLEGFVKRMYATALKREPEEEGFKYWILALKSGEKSALDMAEYFFDSPEFRSLNLSDEEFLNRLYETVMDREADKEGFEYWLRRLNEDLTRKDVVDMFVDSPEFRDLAAEYGIKKID